MGKLKVAFVLDDTLDTPDGVQQYVLTLGAWFSKQGHDVHYLVGQTKRTDIPGVHTVSRNLKVKFNGNRMSTPLPVSRRHIRTLLEQEKFDVLHVQMPYSPFMAQQVILAAPAATAVVGTFHIAPHSSLVRYANQALRLMVGRSLRRFDTILSVSPAAAAFAKQTFHIDTAVLPNVVEPTRFASAAAVPDLAGKPTIVFLGRLVPRKGCRILLQAAASLRQDPAVPDFQLVICGGGPLDDELKSYAAQNGLNGITKFTGFVSEADKARYLHSADIAVFPSTGGESFGIVLIEAMSAGHPVVLGADNDGYKTVLEPYPELLVPVGNPAALAGKIKFFLSSAAARNQALKWQQSYVRQFDVNVVGARLLARYNQALRSKNIMR